MTTAIKERPIIMSADSVRAILDGRKTQTRRVVQPQPGTLGDNWIWSYHHRGIHGNSEQIARFMRQHSTYPVGSRWWVRETWRPVWLTPRRRTETLTAVQYAADYEFSRNDWRGVVFGKTWRSPIYMPRWASRITLEVVGVRAERLHDITDVDARAEGVLWVEKEVDGQWQPCATEQYRFMWDAINAKRGYPWDSNPWVWVVEFQWIGGEG